MQDLSWGQARARAAGAARPLDTVACPLAEAAGRVLANPLTALCDLPSFDTAAMDGWAVAGSGPWRVRGRVLAGAASDALAGGEAVEIATGAVLPAGATGVLRREHGDPRGSTLWGEVAPGLDVRPRAQECRAGEDILPAGGRVTPAVVGLAAAAGYDQVEVVREPRADVLVLGDELLPAGPPRDGRVRDAIGPMLPGLLARAGA
ncbi:MAG: molybdopterin molybdenumtransferase MoeA, partial [Carbonactinosporaceae bacterium]